MGYILPPLKEETASASDSVNVTVNTATLQRSKGVDVNVTGDYDFCFDGTTWISKKARQAGVIYPYQVVGVRKAGGDAPAAGDIDLLY